MKVFFRVDSSATIGHGHLMRCLTLARSLRDAGADVVFVCRELADHRSSVAEQNGFAVTLLPPALDWQEDATATRAAIDRHGSRPDWVIVDSYELDRRWESKLRQSTGRLMVIDDLAREHECDLLLDQNLVRDARERYDGKVPAETRLLLGPRYALINPVYARMHEQVRLRQGDIKRILVSFGGADVTDVTSRVVSAFLQLDRGDIQLDVVCSASKVVEEKLRKETAQRRNVRVHGVLESLAPLMADADLGIGAGGSTAWERLCLGLPSVIVTLADNQQPIARALHAEGLARWLGDHASVSQDDIAAELDRLLSEGLDADWSRRCAAVVDGRGTIRVHGAIAAGQALPLRVRPVTAGDEALLLQWANDAETRANGFSQRPITAEEHSAWFGAKLRAAGDCLFYIVETQAGCPAGQVRFEREDGAWQVHYAVAPEFRGLGLGRALLQSALTRLGADAGDVAVYGLVKEGNRRSCRIFESLGFTARTGRRPGVVVYNGRALLAENRH